MRELTSEALARLAIAALERTAFLMAERDDGGGDALPQASHFVQIEYRGPERGHVLLAASEGFVRSLVAGVLGDDPGSADIARHGADAMREMANILGGSLISEIGGACCPFLLGLPADCTAAQMPQDPTESATLNVEGERLDVYWVRESTMSEAA
ncbi:MAG: chemotaxis protein CheX [Phycisphaerales bacterium]